MESLAGYLSSKIQAKMQVVLKDNAEDLNKSIDKYLKNFNVQINKFESELKGFQVNFDAVKALPAD